MRPRDSSDGVLREALADKSIIAAISDDLASRISEEAIEREKADLTEKSEKLKQLALIHVGKAKQTESPLTEIDAKLVQLPNVPQRVSEAISELPAQASHLAPADLNDFRQLISKTAIYDINSTLIKNQIMEMNEKRTSVLTRIGAVGHLSSEQINQLKHSPHSTNDLEYICIQIEKNPLLIKSTPNMFDYINAELKKLEQERQQLITSVLSKVKESDVEKVRIMLQQMTMLRLSLLDQKLLSEKKYSRVDIVKQTHIIHAKSEVASKYKFDPTIFLSKHFHIGEHKAKIDMAAASNLLSPGHIEIDSVKDIKEKYQSLIDSYSKLQKGNEEAMQKLLKDFGSTDKCIQFINDLLAANEAYKILCRDYKANIDLYQRQGVKPPATINGTPYTGVKLHSEPGISPQSVSPELLSDAGMLLKIRDRMLQLDKDFRAESKVGVLATAARINYPIDQWKKTIEHPRTSELVALSEKIDSTLPVAAKAKESQDAINAAFIRDRTLKEKETQQLRDMVKNGFSAAFDIAAAAALGPVGTTVSGIVKLAFDEVKKQVPAIRDSLGVAVANKLIKDPYAAPEGAAKSESESDIGTQLSKAIKQIRAVFEEKFKNIENQIPALTKEVLDENPNKVFSTIELQKAVEIKMSKLIEKWEAEFDLALETFNHHVEALSGSKKAQMITRDVASIAKKMTNIEVFKGKLDDINDFCDHFPELWRQAKGRWGNDILIGAIENTMWLGGPENAELRESLGFVKKTQIEKLDPKKLVNSAIKMGREKVEDLTQAFGVTKETHLQRQRLLTAFAASIVVFSLNKHCGSALTAAVVTPQQKAATLLDIFTAAARLPEFGSRTQPDNNMIFRLIKTMPDVNDMLKDMNVMRKLIKLRSSPTTKLMLKSEEVANLDSLMWAHIPKILITPMTEHAKQAIHAANDPDERISAIIKMLNVITEIQQLPRHYQLDYKNDFDNALRICHDAIPKSLDARTLKMLTMAITKQNKLAVANIHFNSDPAVQANVIVQCLLLTIALQRHQNDSQLTAKNPLLEQLRQTPEMAVWLKNPAVLEQVRKQDGYEQLPQSLHHAFHNVVNVQQHLDDVAIKNINELTAKVNQQLSEEKDPRIQESANLELIAKIAMLHHLRGLDNKAIISIIKKDDTLKNIPGMEKLLRDPKMNSKLYVCMIKMDESDYQEFAKTFFDTPSPPVAEKSKTQVIEASQIISTKASRESQIAIREDMTMLVNISNQLNSYLKQNNNNPLFKKTIELLNQHVQDFKKILANKSPPSPLSNADYQLLKTAITNAREQIAKESNTIKFKVNKIKLFGKSGNEQKKLNHLFDLVDKVIDLEFAKRQRASVSPKI